MKFKLPASANEEGPQPPHPSPLQLLGPFHISLILHFIALGTLHHWILSPPYLDIWIFHLELTVKNNLSDPVKHLCWSSPPDQTFNFTYMACHVDNMKIFFSSVSGIHYVVFNASQRPKRRMECRNHANEEAFRNSSSHLLDLNLNLKNCTDD